MISHKSSPCSSLFTSLQARTELEHRNALRLVCVNDAVNGIALRDVDQNSKKTVQETKNGSFTPRNAAWPWICWSLMQARGSVFHNYIVCCAVLGDCLY